MNNYASYVISNKPHLFPNIEKSIAPEKVCYFDGTGYPSFSKLVNECVHQAHNEIVIIMSDKVLPSASDVQKVVSLIEKGYGFVALYRFAFFGFKKELFRQIGPMDERFVSGGYEDDDFYIRLHEANISMYINEEIPYTKSHSSWNYSRSKVHFVNKWVDTSGATYNPDAKLSHNPISRKLQEEIYNYDLGASIPTSFLSWDYTFCPIAKPRKYMKAPKNPKEIK